MKYHKNQSYAIITGAAKRLGAVMAKHLAKNGFNLCIHYNTSVEEAEKLKLECEKFEVDVILYQQDFCLDLNHLLIDFAYDHFKKAAFVLINNASIFEAQSFTNTNLETLEANFNIHFKLPFLLSKRFSETQKEKGKIINIIDTRINWHDHSFFAYSLSKKSLASLTQLLAKELNPRIQVNGISPGALLKPEQSSPESDSKIYGDLSNLTSTLEYIIQNDFLTGEIITIDGGEKLK
jgi:NAD(P)-dependent dehydrogenase (short-subunit alcohol dehydrogenase family)